MNPVIMHINYAELEYGHNGANSARDVCRMAAEAGYDGIEFRSSMPQGADVISFEDHVKAIAAGKKEFGLSHILFAIPMSKCLDSDAQVRREDLAQAISKLHLVHDLCETTVCNTFGSGLQSRISTAPMRSYEFHGSGAATEQDYEMTAEAFRKLGDEAEKLGVKMGFETHMHYIHDLPASAMKLVNMIDSPAIGINMDYGNTVYFPDIPTLEETIDLYGDKLFYTHLKNSVSVADTRFPTALSEGQINHRKYLAKLMATGFDGPIGIEAPRPGDRVWFATQDITYFKALRAAL